MSCIISGWVIVRAFDDCWVKYISIPGMLLQSYDVFGCLFGVRNYANFKPLAEGRGIPKDIGRLEEEIKEESKGFHSHTWISWEEIKKINWNEKGKKKDDRIHVYKRWKNGKLKFHEKALVIGKEYAEELKKKGFVFKYEKIKRKDALFNEWKLLFKLMQILAKPYGNKNVRLVVCFLD